MKIVVDVGGCRLEGSLLDTPAAVALGRRLPVEVAMARWGDEYYGDLGASLGSFGGEKVEVLEVGSLAYWEPGNALCLFFGPTPASTGSEARAASPVSPLGRVDGDWSSVKALGPRARVRVSAG